MPRPLAFAQLIPRRHDRAGAQPGVTSAPPLLGSYVSALLGLALLVSGCDRMAAKADVVSSPALTASGAPPTFASSASQPKVASTGSQQEQREGCPRVTQPQAIAEVERGAVSEASGLVASDAGHFWVHNDSGDAARVYALSSAGKLLARYDLQGAQHEDWEDIALGPAPTAGAFLYLADIGDNQAEREDGVVVYRVAEPELEKRGRGKHHLSEVSAFKLRYPDGPRDAEVLLVDPVMGDLFIVTKSFLGNSEVFVARAPLPSQAELVPVQPLSFGVAPLEGSPLVTAGDVTRDGRWVALRTYTSAFMWRRDPALPLEAAFRGTPCVLPLAREPQGETFAFGASEHAYYTLSEGTEQPLYKATWPDADSSLNSLTAP